MYLQHWRYAGILKINDLFDTQQNCFSSFDSFRNKFNGRCNFLQYFSLKVGKNSLITPSNKAQHRKY